MSCLRTYSSALSGKDKWKLSKIRVVFFISLANCWIRSHSSFLVLSILTFQYPNRDHNGEDWSKVILQARGLELNVSDQYSIQESFLRATDSLQYCNMVELRRYEIKCEDLIDTASNTPFKIVRRKLRQSLVLICACTMRRPVRCQIQVCDHHITDSKFSLKDFFPKFDVNCWYFIMVITLKGRPSGYVFI
jgi:hypothetical protein